MAKVWQARLLWPPNQAILRRPQWGCVLLMGEQRVTVNYAGLFDEFDRNAGCAKSFHELAAVITQYVYARRVDEHWRKAGKITVQRRGAIIGLLRRVCQVQRVEKFHRISAETKSFGEKFSRRGGACKVKNAVKEQQKAQPCVA